MDILLYSTSLYHFEFIVFLILKQKLNESGCVEFNLKINVERSDKHALIFETLIKLRLLYARVISLHSIDCCILN